MFLLANVWIVVIHRTIVITVAITLLQTSLQQRCQKYHKYYQTHLQSQLLLRPPLDPVPEYDGVLDQGEEDQHHAGQQPDLQRCHRVGHRDLGAETTTFYSS